MRDADFFEQYLFCESEDDGVRADAEGEREDGDDGEAGTLAQGAESEEDVHPKVVPEAQAKRSTDVALVGLDAAELDAGAAQCFRFGYAAIDQVGGVALDVELHFGDDAVFKSRAMHDGGEPGTQAGERGHNSSGVALRILAMSADMRFHFLAAKLSWRLPAAVRR